jgi:hypothetical protein
MTLERWQEKLGREIEQLSRAPFFVQHPDALVLVRDELKRIREGRGTDLELEEDDDTWAVVDNARRLNAVLARAGQEIDELERTELDLFTAGAAGRGVALLPLIQGATTLSTSLRTSWIVSGHVPRGRGPGVSR